MQKRLNKRSMMGVISAIVFIAITAIFTPAKAKVEIKEDIIGYTFDFQTLNELDQQAEVVWKSRDLEKMQAFQVNVKAFLDTGSQEIESFMTLMDGNDKMNQSFLNRHIITGQLHPFLVHTFFDVIIPPILQANQELDKGFFKEKKRKRYDIEMYLVGLQIKNQYYNKNEFSDVDSHRIQNYEIIGKRALIVQSLISVLDIRSCAGDLSPIDFLSGVWYLDIFVNKLFPNRAAWVSSYAIADECSTRLLKELGFSYIGRMQSHAQKTFGHSETLFSR